MNALRVETCMLYMYFKETSLISHASLESSNKESINQLVAPLSENIYELCRLLFFPMSLLQLLHIYIYIYIYSETVSNQSGHIPFQPDP